MAAGSIASQRLSCGVYYVLKYDTCDTVYRIVYGWVCAEMHRKSNEDLVDHFHGLQP
jgi:hypothetical protein